MSQSSDDLRSQRLRAFDAFFADDASPLQRPGAPGGLPEAWFLGPKAENDNILLSLVVQAIAQHCAFRRSFHPEDPTHITDAVKQSPEYHEAVAQLNSLALMLFEQMRHSAPFSSMRYQSHMLWDQALPAVVGYIGALLYNQNNVAAEASPVTTWLEIVVGNDLCRMLGFSVQSGVDTTSLRPDTIVPWGHITCDGTVANIESLWAARNVKFLALALREALAENSALVSAKGLKVRLLNGTHQRLLDIHDPWMLLNLPIDSLVNLPHVIKENYQIDPAITVGALHPYAVQNIGLIDFYDKFLTGVGAPVVMAPATRHYSWPKAMTLLGLGQNNLQAIPVNLQARMDVGELKKKLDACLDRKQPVISVIAVMGSTEESAVDPLRAIIDLRKEYRTKGFDFAIHCDAAWGGYFNTIRTPSVLAASATSKPAAPTPQLLQPPRLHFLARFEQMLAEIPSLPMSTYVNEQYAAMAEVDSITVDPHKAGYAPYPAGSICYRNSAMRDLISLKAPVVFHSALEPTVGIYGIEGSKPGAAAAAAWLAHKVIPLSQSGYGKILGQCMWTSKRLYCRLVTMQDRDRNRNRRYSLTPFQMLPAERNGATPSQVQIEKQYIAKNFVNCTNAELLELLARDPNARKLFGELGSDQVILAYSFNFKKKNGEWNTDPHRLAKLNQKIFEICSIMDPNDDLNSKPLILTSSDFDVLSYCAAFVQHYSNRLGIDNPENATIPFLISTTMDPWTTDTEGGDFLKVVEDALRNVVHRALATLNF
jgi:glutamate/tyrosine decarboxylase-like PLP-dependent enzyme